MKGLTRRPPKLWDMTLTDLTLTDQAAGVNIDGQSNRTWTDHDYSGPQSKGMNE